MVASTAFPLPSVTFSMTCISPGTVAGMGVPSSLVSWAVISGAPGSVLSVSVALNQSADRSRVVALPAVSVTTKRQLPFSVIVIGRDHSSSPSFSSCPETSEPFIVTDTSPPRSAKYAVRFTVSPCLMDAALGMVRLQ